MIRRHEFEKDSKRKYRNKRTTQTYEDKTEWELEIQLPSREKKDKIKTGRYKVVPKLFRGESAPGTNQWTGLSGLHISVSTQSSLGYRNKNNTFL